MSTAEWVKVPVMPTIQRIACRIGGRILVGPSLCMIVPQFGHQSVLTLDRQES